MKKFLQISIPTPCHENWDAMTPEAKGRFCSSCQKTVFDFTKSSDREIASVLENTNNACGRFTTGQLNRDLVIPQEKSSLWMAASAVIISFLTLGTNASYGQQAKTTSTYNLKLKKAKQRKTPITNVPEVKIEGKVLDTESLPIPHANIRLPRTNYITTTDIDGNFTINTRKGDLIEVSFTGFLTQNITVTTEKKIILILQQDPDASFSINQTFYRSTTRAISGGATIIVPRIYSAKRTFFGRIFHSIGNIFR